MSNFCDIFSLNSLSSTTLMQGKIKTVKIDKNFGFISREDGAPDVFFHGSALQGMQMGDNLLGQMVEFDVEDSDKGPRAVNVKMA